MTADFFSPDFVSARDRFRQAAQRLGCPLESHSIGCTAPNGEDLTIDVALSSAPSEDQSRCLVISSGVHGVEGYFGSAVQLAALQAWQTQPASAPRCRWVMIHAVNPYGMAWRRRVNEDNVDLNRNLLLEGERYGGSPEGYARLDGFINPKSPSVFGEPVRLKIAAAILRHGRQAVQQAVSSGQYDYPKGLFFGGSRPTRSKEILDQHFTRWVDGAERIMHLDLHTGLGPSGEYQMMVDHPIDDRQHSRLDAAFGADRVRAMGPGSWSAALRGTFGVWGHSRRHAGEYLYAAAEFGTHHVARVLAALRTENRCTLWGTPGDHRTERAKRELLEAFCPESSRWREQVLASGLRIVEQAQSVLAG